MTAALVAAAPPDSVYRIGRAPDAWAWPDWRHASDGTLGNRYDDPQGHYRVLYASSQRIGAFLETLARFRPDPALLAEPITGDPRDGAYPAPVAGLVPRAWARGRRLGTARLTGAFCDIGHSASLAVLRSSLAHRVVHFGLEDLEGGQLRQRAPRRFTQELSRFVYEASDDGERAFDGIRYRSRLGDEIDNWAIFEPAQLDDKVTAVIAADDPDLLAVAERFGLALT